MLESAKADLSKYFAEGPYHFSMAFGRGTVHEFFAPTNAHSEIIRQRRELLNAEEARHLATLREAEPLIMEAIEIGKNAQTLPSDLPATSWALGANWEPDFLLLTRKDDVPRLVCGCVCFPSSWSLQDKIGKPIDFIHSVVPGLNASVGRQINTFLARLRPGVAWTRSNWGLSRWPVLNQHPALGLARLDPLISVDDVFLRVEEQALVALPRTNGILFGIRIKVFSLAQVVKEGAGGLLRNALKTMPEEMARYKGLGAARPRIIELLGARSQ